MGKGVGDRGEIEFGDEGGVRLIVWCDCFE